jgi:hypothetical protein
MMLRTFNQGFNIVPTMSLSFFMAPSIPRFALAKQELGSIVSQDQNIKQALQTYPTTDKLHRASEQTLGEFLFPWIF